MAREMQPRASLASEFRSMPRNDAGGAITSIAGHDVTWPENTASSGADHDHDGVSCSSTRAGRERRVRTCQVRVPGRRHRRARVVLASRSEENARSKQRRRWRRASAPRRSLEQLECSAGAIRGAARMRRGWRLAPRIALRQRIAGRSWRLWRTKARLSGEDVTGAVSRRLSKHRHERDRVAWSHSSTLCPLSFRCVCAPHTLSRCSLSDLCATASALGLASKPAAVGLCCQFSTSSRTM